MIDVFWMWFAYAIIALAIRGTMKLLSLSHRYAVLRGDWNWTVVTIYSRLRTAELLFESAALVVFVTWLLSFLVR